MRPLKRQGINKRKSAGQFRNDSRKTKAANLGAVMRGGIRL